MFAIRVERACLQQRDAILHFLLDHFRLEEPLSHSLHLTVFDAQKFFGDMVDRGLIKSVSFVALTDQNEIVGCRMNELVELPVKKPITVCTKGETDDEHHHHCPSRRSQWAASVRKVADFLDYLARDLESLLPPGVKKVMKFNCVSVHPDYQRRGLAQKLIEASLELAADLGCDYAVTGATAQRSQRLFETKLGFETLRVVEHKDYLDPDTKQPVFKCDDGTTCAKLMSKKINVRKK